MRDRRERFLDSRDGRAGVRELGEVDECHHRCWLQQCTSYLDFDPELAHMMAAGLPKESTVPMAERFASAAAKSELATDLTEMALCRVESVREALLERFAGGAEASRA